MYEVEADEVAPSLKFASAKVTKVSRSRAESGSSGGRDSARGREDSDPWAAEGPGGYSDEPPF